MNRKGLIGKRVDVKKFQNCSDEFSLPEEIEEGEDYYYEYGQFTKAEIYLRNFACENSYDTAGYNAYSIKVIVDGDKIVKLIKVAHCHFCNNEGSDDEVDRFPHNSLEAEASEYMAYCILTD